MLSLLNYSRISVKLRKKKALLVIWQCLFFWYVVKTAHCGLTWMKNKSELGDRT